MIKAYWFDRTEHDHELVWQCPHCRELNEIENDFVWNEEVKQKVAVGIHKCQHCESEDKHIVFKD